MTTLTPQQTAQQFAEKCREHGFSWSAKFSSVAITKKFPAGSAADFADCEMAASIILDYCPLKGGSIWGTDGGSIGGATAMRTGLFKLNKSGNGKRFLNALKKLG